MHENEPIPNGDEENFEDLRLENEILKLKMQAESGASFHSLQEIPPEIEHQFLQQIMAFDEAIKGATMVPIYDFIGKPTFRPLRELDATAIRKELKRLLALLKKNSIDLNFNRKYDPAVMYQFLTEEFFRLETSDCKIPGFIRGYIYEEFHPDHEADMRDTAGHFFYNWFNQDFEQPGWTLSQIVLPDGTLLSKEKFREKLNSFFASFPAFPEHDFTIVEVNYEWNEAEKRGVGHVGGVTMYDARMENGETIRFKGTFQLYMVNETGFWQICYFNLPGFVW